MPVDEIMDYESDDSSSWEDVEEYDDDEGVGAHSLLHNSLILEKIFEFLPLTDLLDCRLVCKEWNKTALLRKLLGARFQITVNKTNFDRLLKTAQHSPYSFCRKFDFRLLELEIDRISKFIRIFGDRLSSLSVKFCTASSAESVIKILNCPRLEELKIYGALPEIKEENFHSFTFTRLNILELHSSLDYGQVNQTFIQIILKHAPNIHTVNIGQSLSLWTDLCLTVSRFSAPKLCHVGLSGLEAPLDMEHFQLFFAKQLHMRKVNLINCLVRPDFLQQFLQQTFKTLTVLNIEGTQQEILSKAFREVSLPNLKQLTLSIDGVSTSDGIYILRSAPNLSCVRVVGLFQTFFQLQMGQLISVALQERYLTTIFTRGNIQNVVSLEKRREYLKVLSLFPLQPRKLEINLSLSTISSRCFRAIYSYYPDLEHLVVISNSAKQLLVGLTGIPHRVCRKMTHCKSFAVVQTAKPRFFPSIRQLQKLKQLQLAILDETPSAESTLLLVVYGICGLDKLEELTLSNFTMTDIAFMNLAQTLSLTSCKVNGSENRWAQFLSFFKKHTIKSFLLPPPNNAMSVCNAPESVGKDSKILKKIFNYMNACDVHQARNVSHYWHAVSSVHLHKNCLSIPSDCFASQLEHRLSQYHKLNHSPSPRNHAMYYMGERQTPALSRILKLWNSLKKETSLAIISLGASALECFQLDNCRPERRNVTCHQRRQLEYWYYPDGSDDLVYPPTGKCKSEKIPSKILENISTLLVIGCWDRKDKALLEFLNPSWSVSTIHLVGVQKETLDLVLPKLISMINLESLLIKPWVNSSAYCELTRTHLQILRNASFKLKNLSMRLHAPSEAVVDFVRSQRFTLETLEVHSNVNVSDRLTFAIPQLKLLQLDEPPGCLLRTTLNVHSSLETINFGRSGCAYNQIRGKSSSDFDQTDTDFEHSATEILCDVNWFLETSPTRRTGVQKSILQQGTDSALKFFMHFPFLSSLTLRSVHAHYGILQGIFKKFTQLTKLELINATGVTDEIMTGFSKEILDEMDIMNPFQTTRERNKTENHRKGFASIRNLKCLTHLSLDDQPTCTDFSVIFGVLKLDRLQVFSCKKWKITDVALRALADVLPSLKNVNTDGCANVSKYALEYFNESRTLKPLQ
ncbi:unnamed protein product [Orchesella dallaii]|uniref:F-box domain-containing protein n=1 Tax=Orchesella dallaii TaxID=48710 RepID=A0ABP1QA78_9HEXA